MITITRKITVKIALTLTIPLILNLLTLNHIHGNKEKQALDKLSKEEKEDLQGRKKLPLNTRINAEKRYEKLVEKLTIPEDKDDICNQLLYIENGYFDYGYMPKLNEYYEYKNVPEGFWVYVYPNWYIWKEQVLF